MSIQQPAPNMLQHPAIQQPPPNMLQHPAVWPWSYHYAQSQMAAQAMNAAAMSLQGACLITSKVNNAAVWICSVSAQVVTCLSVGLSHTPIYSAFNPAER